LWQSASSLRWHTAGPPPKRTWSTILRSASVSTSGTPSSSRCRAHQLRRVDQALGRDEPARLEERRHDHPTPRPHSPAACPKVAEIWPRRIVSQRVQPTTPDHPPCSAVTVGAVGDIRRVTAVERWPVHCVGRHGGERHSCRELIHPCDGWASNYRHAACEQRGRYRDVDNRGARRTRGRYVRRRMSCERGQLTSMHVGGHAKGPRDAQAARWFQIDGAAQSAPSRRPRRARRFDDRDASPAPQPVGRSRIGTPCSITTITRIPPQAVVERHGTTVVGPSSPACTQPARRSAGRARCTRPGRRRQRRRAGGQVVIR